MNFTSYEGWEMNCNYEICSLDHEINMTGNLNRYFYQKFECLLNNRQCGSTRSFCLVLVSLLTNLLFINHRIEDGIVLSPQRQSFVQGCHIPQSAPERNSQQDRVKAGLSRTTDREREGRSRLTGRVGRGRALDYKERTPLQERNKVQFVQ